MVFAGAWIGQFIGHGVFERRAPALKDNLVQGESYPARFLFGNGNRRGKLMVALVTAPFFVHLELMFGLFHCESDAARRRWIEKETS